MDDDLAALGREALALSRRFAAADDALAGESAGHDPADAVRVVTDGDGRIMSVTIDPTWRRRVTKTGLGAAVVQAVEEAGRRRVEAWADALRTPFDAAEPPPAAPPAPAPPAPVDTAFARGLFHVLQDVSAQLDDLTGQLERQAGRALVGRDPQRHVTVTVVGAVVAGVDLDPDWLGSVRPPEIGSAVVAAAWDAYAQADRLAAAVTDRWPFAELNRMTADPSTLLAHLGLPVPGDLRGGVGDGTK